MTGHGEARARRYNAETYARLWQHARFQPPERTPWWPLVARLAASAEARLELGPGPWPRLPVAGTHVVDLAAPALELLAARGAIAHHGTLAELGLPARAFDLIGVFEVLEHVQDDEALLAELARLARPGAALLVSVPLGMRFWNAFDGFAGHERRYEPAELRGKLERAGFAPELFEARHDVGGRLAAWLVVLACRRWPRLALWVTEQVALPAALRRPLRWHPMDDWQARTRDATGCTLLCRRR